MSGNRILDFLDFFYLYFVPLVFCCICILYHLYFGNLYFVLLYFVMFVFWRFCILSCLYFVSFVFCPVCITSISGPLGPEMLALRLALRANLFQTNEPTRRFMYIDGTFVF